MAALVAGLVACGGGGTSDDGPGATPTVQASPVPAAPLAEAVRIDAAVDVSLAGADFSTVDDEPAPVAIGDIVRTDDAGFAEIAYYDGSVVRLDVDTSLEVLALSDTPGAAEVTTRMELGRTWNRVSDDVPDRTYTVETNVATATVRGTAFIVDCPDVDRCTFSVLEGVVEVTPSGGDPFLLSAPDALEVVAGEEPSSVPAIAPDADPWLARNVDLDGMPLDGVLSGDGSAPDGGSGADDSLDSFTGRWDATTSDFRIVEATGAYAGATIDLSEHPDFVFVRGPDGNGQGFGLFAGGVDIECEYGSCSIADADEEFLMTSMRRDLDGRLVMSEGGPTCGVEVPGAREVRDLTASSFRWTEVVAISDSAGFGDCGDYAAAAYEVTMTRVDG